jgi:hypothetical protein
VNQTKQKLKQINREKLMKRYVFSILVMCCIASTSFATTVTVGHFGDQGWKSDDTRTATGINLVGINNTHAGKPGQTPTAADDVSIASQIQFVDGPSGSTYGGAVSINGTNSNNGKSNISVISPVTGFDAGSNLLTTFTATYQWYGQPNPLTRTLVFKLGIQSTSWGTDSGQSQNGFTATRSGESVWDLLLVHLPASASDYAWSTVHLDHDSGTWSLCLQEDNTFFPVSNDTKTLDDWNADPTFGPLLFGTGAKVSSIQFGLGSYRKQSIAYVDYLQTNLLNGGDVVNFVPEPTAMALLGLGTLGFIRRNRKV